MIRLQHIACIVSLITWLATGSMQAQELHCNVQINSDQIEGSNKEVFNTLQQSIDEFLNYTQWTGMTFAEIEKIDCNLFIIVKSVNDNLYNCEATIQASRPVFNTSYTTTLLNLKDNAFNFSYQLEQLTYQNNSFQGNLTAMLAYYAYLIIGIDADSYQRLAGTPYFLECEQIVNMCQGASMEKDELPGWQHSYSARNRYALVNNLMDESIRPFRTFFYDYHRLGLDEMEANVGNARARILEGLPALKEVNRNRPSNYIVAPFLDAKTDEIVEIFQGGNTEEKEKVTELLMDLDPTRSNEYDRINTK